MPFVESTAGWADKRWPAGNGVMRRPLAPPPCRPNPTDPGDAADLSIPQGYQCIRKSFSRDFFASPHSLHSPSNQRAGLLCEKANGTAGEINHQVSRSSVPSASTTIIVINPRLRISPRSTAPITPAAIAITRRLRSGVPSQ